MAKKSNNKTKAKNKAANTSKVNKKAIIIAGAVLGVIVVVLAVLLILKHFGIIGEEKVPVAQGTTVAYNTVDPDNIDDPNISGTKYVYVDYNGILMPKEFADIFNQAAVDSAKACELGGVAMTVGDRQISKSEFEMNYHLIAVDVYGNAAYSDLSGTSQKKSIDYNKAPDAQNYGQEDYTWEDKFIEETVTRIRTVYSEFDRAAQLGITFTDAEVSQIMSVCRNYDNHAKRENMTTDEFIGTYYGPGSTHALLCRMIILNQYAGKTSEVSIENLKAEAPYENAKAVYDKSPQKYKLVNCRIYPIEGEYVESEAAAVKDEKSYIAYAEKNHSSVYGTGADMEANTRFWYTGYASISGRFGEEVAEWAFSADRKEGDVSVVKGMFYNYLVYIKEPAFNSVSCDILIGENYYIQNSTSEDMDKVAQSVIDNYDAWKESDGTVEGFKTMANSQYSVTQQTTRAGEYGTEIAITYWVHDKERKPGDSAVLVGAEGTYIVYFLKENSDDYDWLEVINEEYAYTEYDKLVGNNIKQNYEHKLYDNVVQDACDEVYALCKKHVENIKSQY